MLCEVWVSWVWVFHVGWGVFVGWGSLVWGVCFWGVGVFCVGVFSWWTFGVGSCALVILICFMLYGFIEFLVVVFCRPVECGSDASFVVCACCRLDII